MYTNISADHGIATVSSWLDDIKDQLPEKFTLEPLKIALEMVMRNNVFEFGDTRYLQLMGTARLSMLLVLPSIHAALV